MKDRQVDSRARLDDQLLMAAVAQRHYFDNRTAVELAEEFAISRFKVRRLLDAALESGLVEIKISLPASVDADLSLRLRDRFGLSRAVVTVPRVTDDATVRDALGVAAAELLGDLVTSEDVLGVTSGRTINAIARHLTAMAGCEIVQLTGMSGSLDDNPVEVLRRVAVVSGGRARTIYAPLILASAEAATALREDPQCSETFGRFSSVTIALAAIGSFDPPKSRLYNGLSPADRQAMVDRGVIADIGGTLLDASGKPVHDLDDRLLGVTFEQLAEVRQVIVVGGGQAKVPAIMAGLRSGVISTLVTDDSVARALLDRES